MRIRSTLLPVFLAFLCGCAADPYQRPPLPILNNPDPQRMRQDTASTLDDRFISDDTVIIHAPFRDDMAVLGVLRVDRPAGTFELVGLNHMGIQLFALSGDGANTTIRFAVPPLSDQHEVLMSIAQDMRRMYFDLLPADDAHVEIQATQIQYRQESPQETIVYDLGDTPSVLLEKHREGFFGTIWRVRYFKYVAAAGKLHPSIIVMDNNTYHYRIVVKNRQWSTE
jgi:hypothetical protein